MGELRLPKPNRREQAPSQGKPLPPLGVHGVGVKKAELVKALRPYLPTICDIIILDEGETFYLVLGPTGPQGSGSQT